MGGRRRAGIVAGLATICLVALLVTFVTWDGGAEHAGDEGAGEVIVVRAPGDRRTAARVAVPRDDPASLPASIRAAVPDPGVELRNVRVVDAGRNIACGERTVPGSAALRRFVWLGQAGIVVTDDGGPDFANLVFVCDPSRPGAR